MLGSCTLFFSRLKKIVHLVDWNVLFISEFIWHEQWANPKLRRCLSGKLIREYPHESSIASQIKTKQYSYIHNRHCQMGFHWLICVVVISIVAKWKKFHIKRMLSNIRKYLNSKDNSKIVQMNEPISPIPWIWDAIAKRFCTLSQRLGNKCPCTSMN